MCMGCAIVCTVLVYLGKISGAEFVAIILGTVAAYITGNTMQHNNQVKYDRSSDEDNKA